MDSPRTGVSGTLGGAHYFQILDPHHQASTGQRPETVGCGGRSARKNGKGVSVDGWVDVPACSAAHEVSTPLLSGEHEDRLQLQWRHEFFAASVLPFCCSVVAAVVVADSRTNNDRRRSERKGNH